MIHETAIVEDPLALGEGTSVWHHAHVRAGARVGSNCTIGKNVYIDAEAVVGDRVKIQNNVNVYAGVEISDDVFVGPQATFTNDLCPRAFSADWEVVPTKVASGASIGASATIVCGTTIGRYAMVGAGAVVTRDVADHQLVLGNPAKPSGWVCQCGRVTSRDVARPTSFTCQCCTKAERST